MPEIISKYPETTIELLRDAGARCGEGLQPKILTKCPPAQFCVLPTGEMCVYGLDAIPQMTQVTPRELAHAVSPYGISLSIPELALLGAALAAGVVAGRLWSGRKRARR